MLRFVPLVALTMLVPGCSMPQQERTARGPAFTLTPDVPVAAFDVTLCLEGPDPHDLHVWASVQVSATSTTGRPVLLRMESLERDGFEDDGYVEDLHIPASSRNTGSFALGANAQWHGGGKRCAAPEPVQFVVEGLEPGESVTVDNWDVTMTVKWYDGNFGHGPDDADLSIEIERL